ncbi:hypothetical protein ABPG75_003889 [Micractinium tetrahymenae]
MAGSQWRDRLLFGGLGLTMLLHAFVLLSGRSATPAMPVDGGMPQHGRKLQGLLDGVLGTVGGVLGGVTGSTTGGTSGTASGDGLLGTGLLDGLTVCGALGGLLQCDASQGDFTVPGKLTIKGARGQVFINPTTLSITTSSSRLTIGNGTSPHTLFTELFKAPGAVTFGTTKIAGDATLNKAVTVNGVLAAKSDFRATKALASARCSCAGKPLAG